LKKSRAITTIGILSALSLILYFLEIPLFVYFPPYLKIDLSDVPAILGGIAFGPLAGVAIELIKNILHFIIRSDSPFASGEIANLFAGIGLMIPIVHSIRKTQKNSVFAYVSGAIIMVIVANIMNFFVTLPLYGTPKSAIWPTILTILIPFNILKAIIVSIVVMALVKKTKRFIFRDQLSNIK
jgi:riboflavin transporter